MDKKRGKILKKSLVIFLVILFLILIGASLFIHFAPVDFDAKACGGGFKSWIFNKYKEQLVCEFVNDYDEEVNADDINIIEGTEEVTWNGREMTISFGILLKDNQYRICFQGKRYWIEKYKWNRFVFATDGNCNNLQQIYLSRINSERDEYIYFGRYKEKYNPVHENNQLYFDELKEKYGLEQEQTNVSIDVSDAELLNVNPYFYYSQKIKEAGSKFQADQEEIDLLNEDNRDLLYERMKHDINKINCPSNLFVDCEAIYMRGIVIEQLNRAFLRDNSTEYNNSGAYSYALPY